MWQNLLESLMLVSFGAAWPTSILKSWRCRTARGKSLSFLLIVEFGYLSGLAAKLTASAVNYVAIFYVVNMLAVGIDILLYFRNRRLDALAGVDGTARAPGRD